MLPLHIDEDGFPLASTINADDENLSYDDLPEEIRHPITSPAQLRAAPWVLRRHFDARDEWDDLTPAQAEVEHQNDHIAPLTTEQQLELERQQRIDVETILDILRIDHAAALRQIHQLSNQFQADVDGKYEPQGFLRQDSYGIPNYVTCPSPPKARQDSLFGSSVSNHSDDDEEYSAHGPSKWRVSTDSASGLMCEDCQENPPRNSEHVDTGDICCTTCGLILNNVLSHSSAPVVSSNSQEDTAGSPQPHSTTGENDLAAQLQKLKTQQEDADAKIATWSKDISLEQELSRTTFKRMNTLLTDMTRQRDNFRLERDNLTTVVNNLLDPRSTIEDAKGVETNIVGPHDLQVRSAYGDFQRLFNDNNNLQEWLRESRYPIQNATQPSGVEDTPMLGAADGLAQDPRQHEAAQDKYSLTLAELDEMRFERDQALRDFEHQNNMVERQATELQQARQDVVVIRGQRDASEEIRIAEAAKLQKAQDQIAALTRDAEDREEMQTLRYVFGMHRRHRELLDAAAADFDRSEAGRAQGLDDIAALNDIVEAQAAEIQRACQDIADLEGINEAHNDHADVVAQLEDARGDLTAHRIIVRDRDARIAELEADQAERDARELQLAGQLQAERDDNPLAAALYNKLKDRLDANDRHIATTKELDASEDNVRTLTIAMDRERAELARANANLETANDIVPGWMEELRSKLRAAVAACDNLRAEVIRRGGRVVGENGEVEGEDGNVSILAPTVLFPTIPVADVPAPAAPVRRSTRVPIPTRRAVPPPPAACHARRPARVRTPAERAGSVPALSLPANVVRPASSTPECVSGNKSSTVKAGTKRKAQGEKEMPSKRKK